MAEERTVFIVPFAEVLGPKAALKEVRRVAAKHGVTRWGIDELAKKTGKATRMHALANRAARVASAVRREHYSLPRDELAMGVLRSEFKKLDAKKFAFGPPAGVREDAAEVHALKSLADWDNTMRERAKERYCGGEITPEAIEVQRQNILESEIPSELRPHALELGKLAREKQKELNGEVLREREAVLARKTLHHIVENIKGELNPHGAVGVVLDERLVPIVKERLEQAGIRVRLPFVRQPTVEEFDGR